MIGLRRFAGLVVLACAFAFAATASPARAHAVLEASDPAAGAELVHAPQSVTLTFDEPVETALGSLRIVGADGRERTTGPVVHPDGDRTRVAVRVQALPRGRYVVTWQVVSADSHVVSGAYAFGVGVPAGDAPALERDAGGAILATVVHFTLLAAALLAVGLPLGALALGTAGGPAALLVEFGAWFVVVLAAFADVELRADLNGGTLGASFATHIGAVRTLAMGAGVVGVASLVRPRRIWGLYALAAAVLVLSLSLGGHAARGAWPALGVTADALHLAAAAVWIGVLAAGANAGASAVLRRISPIATVAVATIVLTGVIQTIRNVGAWPPLIATAYGRAIDLKVALLFGALGLAAAARRSLARGSFTLHRRLSLELAILAAVVAVTAVLVDLPLPRELTAGLPPVSVAFRVADAEVRATATDIDATHWRLHVAAAAGGAARPLDEVDAAATETRKHVGPLAVPMTRSAAGAYDGTIALPFAGAWTGTITARLGDFDETTSTLPLTEIDR